MAAELSTATTLKPYNLLQPSTSSPETTQTLFFTPLRGFRQSKILQTQRKRKSSCFTVCVLMKDPKHTSQLKTEEEIEPPNNKPNPQFLVAQKLARKKSQRFTYLVAAVMSSFGVTSMAILAVYYRFSWQMEVYTWYIFVWIWWNLQSTWFCRQFFFFSSSLAVGEIHLKGEIVGCLGFELRPLHT